MSASSLSPSIHLLLACEQGIASRIRQHLDTGLEYPAYRCIESESELLTALDDRAWRETMGYTEDEVRSLTLMDVLHPDSQQYCQARFERLQAGEELNQIDFKFVAESGQVVHLVGDELLRQISRLLTGQIRSRDTLAPLGGDEFAILNVQKWGTIAGRAA